MECQRLGGSSGESHTLRLSCPFCTFSTNVCSWPLLQIVAKLDAHQSGEAWSFLCPALLQLSNFVHPPSSASLLFPCWDGCFSFPLCSGPILALYDLFQRSALAWLWLWVTHSLRLASVSTLGCLLDICSVLHHSNVACLKNEALLCPLTQPRCSKNMPSLES